MNFIPALKKEVQKLPPAYFTLVMSIGIVSIGADFLKFTLIGEVLFWVNNTVFGILMLMLLSRLLFYPKRILTDLKSFKKGAGFLSLIAAVSILGIQYQLKQLHSVASVLFWIGLIVWVLLIYAFLTSVTTKPEKPSLEKGISGVWLLMVVCTQALAILGTLLNKHLSFSSKEVIFISLCLYTVGIFFYIVLITLIFYRLSFFHAGPKEITPPYWVNEGAMGITTIAGAVFMQNITSTTGFTEFIPFIKGISLLAWATATWWIPFIILLEIWKYGIRKVSLSYTPTYWALVFCVGGYAVATHLFSKALGISFLKSIPEGVFFIALALLGLVFVGMCFSIVKAISSKPAESKVQ